ncbi:hypothetical protein KAJ83_07920 [Marivibrio halodurans]|uniref:Uncharacterized protein n=1 Tax=Marivibrio halodurans TaxID=2039722 RepID=A0A8J7V294_9PROT|nr:hypothetical protein [Marivibrio halodurans]MBP5856931.1 hypothetical protein [Marivibrio halodurans]
MALTYLFSAISIVGLLISIISLLRASSGAVPSIHLLPPNVKTDENTNFRILIHNPSPRMVFLSKIEISYPDEFEAYPIGVDVDGVLSRSMLTLSRLQSDRESVLETESTFEAHRCQNRRCPMAWNWWPREHVLTKRMSKILQCMRIRYRLIGFRSKESLSEEEVNASKKNKKLIDILLYIPPHQKREIQLNLKTIDSGIKFRTHWLKSGIFFDRLLFPFFSIKFTAKELEAIQIAYGHEEDGKT